MSIRVERKVVGLVDGVVVHELLAEPEHTVSVFGVERNMVVDLVDLGKLVELMGVVLFVAVVVD